MTISKKTLNRLLIIADDSYTDAIRDLNPDRQERQAIKVHDTILDALGENADSYHLDGSYSDTDQDDVSSLFDDICRNASRGKLKITAD